MLDTRAVLDFENLATQAQTRQSDTALLVIDAQNIYCTTRPNRFSRTPYVNEGRVENALDNIDVARDYADKQGIPTFLVYALMVGIPDLPSIPYHDEQFALYRQRLSGLFELVAKSHESAFRHNPFSKLGPFLPGLLERDYPNVKNLVLTGFNTSVCVRATAIDALDRTFNVAVLSDCTVNCIMNDDMEERKTFEALEDRGAQVSTFKKWRAQRLQS